MTSINLMNSIFGMTEVLAMLLKVHLFLTNSMNLRLFGLSPFGCTQTFMCNVVVMQSNYLGYIFFPYTPFLFFLFMHAPR